MQFLRNIVKLGILIFVMYNKVIIQTSEEYFQNIYFINNWINKMFSRENKVPTANINKVKQYEVSLFIHFI